MDEALLDHQLVADPGARREERDSLAVGKLLDAPVLRQVFLAGVLDVVVEGEDGLRGVSDPFGADGAELGEHRPRVVVGHDMERAHGDHVAGLDLVAGLEAFGVGLDDFFGDCLCHVSSPFRIPILSVCFPRGATLNIVGPCRAADFEVRVSNNIEIGTSAARDSFPARNSREVPC